MPPDDEPEPAMRLVTEFALLSLTTVAGVFAGFQTPEPQPAEPYSERRLERSSPILQISYLLKAAINAKTDAAQSGKFRETLRTAASAPERPQRSRSNLNFEERSTLTGRAARFC